MKIKSIIIPERMIRLIKQMYEQGFVTRKTQNLYSNIQFYMVIWKLRNLKIVREDGIYKNNKKWVLTEKGKKLWHMIEILLEILDKNEVK